jgi:RNA 3'-terminal phosphate cyclase-like protein
VLYGRTHAKNVSDLLTCRLNSADKGTSIQFLRDAKDFFGTSFKIVPANPSDPATKELLFSCLGTGYTNTNRTLA